MTEPHAHRPTDKSGRLHRRPLLIGALAAIVIAGVVLALWLRPGADTTDGAAEADPSTTAVGTSTESATTTPAETTTAAPTAPSQPTPSGAPGTTTEPAASPDPTPGATTQADTAPAGVLVLITSHEWNPGSATIEVVGSVQGAAATTSTCTVIATNGATALSASVGGVFDGNGTSCGLISIPGAAGSPGPWSVVVQFSYAGGVATSDPVVVTVP